MERLAYLNGDFLPEQDAKVSIFDRGFLFADSVYEVIPFYSGHGFRLAEHVARLQRSLNAVAIEAEQDWAALCTALVERNGGGDQAVYLQITRGNEGYRNHRPATGLQPTVTAHSYPIPAALEGAPERVGGISAVTLPDQRWHRCDIKSTALLANVMALQEALNRGAQEALMVRDGLLSEGSACNLFLIEDGALYTPPLGVGILGGTTRDLLLELARDAGIPAYEQPLPVERIRQVDEAWITSSTKGVIPVLQVDGQAIGSGRKGPVWYRMAELFCAFEQRVRQA